MKKDRAPDIDKRHRRLELYFSEKDLSRFPKALGLWYETPAEVQAGLNWGREKARLLRWVRRQARNKLTPREWRCIELCCLEGLSCREAGLKCGANKSTVNRAFRRAIYKLRAAAIEEPPRPAKLIRKEWPED